MSRLAVNRYNSEIKKFIADSYLKRIPQEKIKRMLYEKGIIISSMSLFRWWKKNKINYNLREIE